MKKIIVAIGLLLLIATGTLASEDLDRNIVDGALLGYFPPAVGEKLIIHARVPENTKFDTNAVDYFIKFFNQRLSFYWDIRLRKDRVVDSNEAVIRLRTDMEYDGMRFIVTKEYEPGNYETYYFDTVEDAKRSALTIGLDLEATDGTFGIAYFPLDLDEKIEDVYVDCR